MYAAPGSYTVSLTVSDGQDLASTEWADDITVWPCPARMDQRPGGPRGLAASNGLSASTSAVPR